MVHNHLFDSHFGFFQPGPCFLDIFVPNLLLRSINDQNLFIIDYNRQIQSGYNVIPLGKHLCQSESLVFATDRLIMLL